MGTKIIETGSTAGGVAKVEYKNEAGNVLWYYDDAGNFVRNGNATITGLAATGTRMVVADSAGNLRATISSDVFMTIQGSTTTPVSTGISINAGNAGKTIMAYVSTQFAGGSSTSSALIMINCGHDGNNMTVTQVATSGSYSAYGVEFSQVDGILYARAKNYANCAIRFVVNK